MGWQPIHFLKANKWILRHRSLALTLPTPSSPLQDPQTTGLEEPNRRHGDLVRPLLWRRVRGLVRSGIPVSVTKASCDRNPYDTSHKDTTIFFIKHKNCKKNKMFSLFCNRSLLMANVPKRRLIQKILMRTKSWSIRQALHGSEESHKRMIDL